MQTKEQKFQGFLECAQRGEVSYDVVYSASVNIGIEPAQAEALIEASSKKRNALLTEINSEEIDLN